MIREKILRKIKNKENISKRLLKQNRIELKKKYKRITRSGGSRKIISKSILFVCDSGKDMVRAHG